MILITGATGFVGRRLIKLLPKYFNKKEILCLVWNRESETERAGRKIIKELGIKIKKVDLVTGNGLKNLPKTPNIVIHLAASVDTSKKDFRCNDIGTINLANALQPLSPKTHFIHIGTMVAYSGRIDCSKPIKEKDHYVPSNEYGRTKATGEKFLVEKCKQNRFSLTVLKPNTIYGNGMRKGSLFDFLKPLINKNSIFARFNWPGLSSLIYVEDVTKIIARVSKKVPSPGKPEVYLLHGENLTLAQMSKQLHKALNLSYKPIILPRLFWRICAFFRKFVPFFEKFLDSKSYNYLWRASIIVDHVSWCESKKIKKIIPHWKPKKLSQVITQVV